MTLTNETNWRAEFDKWCPITITDEGKAPKSTALVKAYWTAWQAGYAAGMARMRWIRVSEQLPELDKAVLCYGQGVYWVAHLRGHFVPRDRMQWEYGGEMVPVDAFTHWAELAAPGAEGEK